MKTIFTKSASKFGCYVENDNEQDKYLPNETFTITDILNADVSLKDKVWFIRKNCEFTDRQFREFAIGCALCVLPTYESKFPDNKAPREAIEAAQSYLAGTLTLDKLQIKRSAATAAATAAYKADYTARATAYAAAYSAYAAAYSAYAAAYSAYADAADGYADGYADAYDYAATNGNYKNALLNFFKEFTNGL